MRRRRRGIKKRSTHEPACNILPRGHKNHLGCVHGILFYSATQRLYIREQTEWGSLARRTTTPREPQVHVLFGSMYVLFFPRSSLSDVFLKGIRRAGQGHSTGCLCHAPVSKKHPTDLPFVCVKAFTTSSTLADSHLLTCLPLSVFRPVCTPTVVYRYLVAIVTS